MVTNNYKKKNQDKPQRKWAISRAVQSILDGSILSPDLVSKHLLFFLFLTSLAFLLIFNTYYAEKQARQIEITRREVVELRTRYINTRSELMFLSNQSEISRRLRSAGFIESTDPPRLVYDNDKNRNIFARWF
jgi:hypothetical protein